MSRNFTKISPDIWHSRQYSGLPSDDARLLMMYLLTSPHQTLAGCFRLPDAYAAADLRWGAEKFDQARGALVAEKLIEFDPLTSEYFIHRWFRHNGPMHTSHRVGIERQIDRMESSHLREAAHAELEAVGAVPTAASAASKPGANLVTALDARRRR